MGQMLANLAQYVSASGRFLRSNLPSTLWDWTPWLQHFNTRDFCEPTFKLQLLYFAII